MVTMPKEAPKSVRSMEVKDRWCGYHGGFVCTNDEGFMAHVNQCESQLSKCLAKPGQDAT